MMVFEKWLALLFVSIASCQLSVAGEISGIRDPSTMDNGRRTKDGDQSVLIDGVAAQVNEHIITIGDVLAAVEPLQRRLSETYEGNELRTRLRKAYEDALSALIEWFLILDSHEKQEMKTPERYVDERINEIIHETSGGDRTEFVTALSRDHLTFDEWQSEIRDHIIVAFMRSFRIEQNIRVSPKAVREAYDKNLERYRIPEKIDLRMIVLRKGISGNDAAVKQCEAHNIRKRLVAGEDFGILAGTLSEGSKASDGGNWGWVEPKILRPELAKLASELEPGEISKVIETEDEFYILKIEGRRNEQVAPFEEVQQQIERELRMKEAEHLYRAWIERLRKDAYVKVFDVELF